MLPNLFAFIGSGFEWDKEEQLVSTLLFPFAGLLFVGKGFEYINELLKASFHEGINIGEDEYLQSTVEKLGLDWNVISKKLGSNDWKKVLDDNLKDMYSGNCWGVPSFKITDANDENPFYVWGQDRMWLLKEEIFRRLH